MRSTLNVLSIVVVVSSACESRANFGAVFDGGAGDWIDLSYAFDEQTVYWPTAVGFALETVSYGETEAGFFYAANNFSAAEHGGTHLDSPIHFFEGRWTTDQIPLESLIGPAVVLDVSDRVSPDYQVTVSDLTGWEGSHGLLPDGAILLIRTGWGDRYPDPLRYLGTATVGPAAVAELHFPALHPDAARWLVAERNISAVGLDTPSIDFGQSTSFESHRALFGANIPAFENVANLDRLPPTGSFVVALPMKISGGTGGPLRIVAFVPH